MAEAWTAGPRRNAPFAGRVAALARALLASGLLPVLPSRATRYSLGPLRRAERARPSVLPLGASAQEPLRQRALRLAEPALAALSLACLAMLLALSRVRAWTRAHPLLGAPDRSALREALTLLAIIRLSRLRRWRRRRFGPPAAWQIRQAMRALDATLVGILGPPVAARPQAPVRIRKAGVTERRWAGPPASRTHTWRREAASRVLSPLPGWARPTQTLRQATLIGSAALAALVLGVALSFLPSLLDPEPAGHSPVRTGSLPSSGPISPPVKPEQTPRVREVAAAKPPDAPLSAVQAAKVSEPYQIAWPFDIADGLTFGPEGATKTRLAGLEGPPRDGVCNDRNGRPWACGLQARAALNNVTRRQALLCEPVKPPAGDLVIAQCRGEIDLARELVLAGFARPTGPDSALEAALDEAQRNERGLWNGGWTIRTSTR